MALLRIGKARIRKFGGVTRYIKLPEPFLSEFTPSIGQNVIWSRDSENPNLFVIELEKPPADPSAQS